MFCPDKRLKKNIFILLWTLIVLAAITSLVILEYFTLTKDNKAKTYKASEVLISEIEHTITRNIEDRHDLVMYLNEIYSAKAKAAAYIIDTNPDLIRKPESLKHMKEVMGIDQLNLFDETGTLISGTDPEYIGMNLDAGEQISYFKPMLHDRTMAMTQEITPNSFDGTEMMYAMCWNERGTHMVQVGILGARLPVILKGNQIEHIVSKIPRNEGTDILITYKDSDIIRASTVSKNIGKTLADAGIFLEGHEQQQAFETGTKDDVIYCSVKENTHYRVLVAQHKDYINKNMPLTLVTFAEYLILVFLIMSFLLDYMYNKFLHEQTIALQDNLTSMYNRREFENVIQSYHDKSMEPDLIFISMDVNGLKQINDALGHNEGDRLLRGAASCMKQVFDRYGKTFRIGGDEFTAIIHADESTLKRIQTDFSGVLKKWSAANNLELCVSVGYVRSSDYPNADMAELAKLADQKMYDEKSKYYTQHDRRRK